MAGGRKLWDCLSGDLQPVHDPDTDRPARTVFGSQSMGAGFGMALAGLFGGIIYLRWETALGDKHER